MDLEPTTIAVRGYIVARERELQRRKKNRRRSRRRDGGSTARESTKRSVVPASTERVLLSPDEEAEATAILGPHPWLSMVYDSETIVAPQAASAILRAGQPLRVGYFELRGLSIYE